MERAHFVQLLEPLARKLHPIDLSAPDARAQVEAAAPFDSPEVIAIRDAALASRETDWLLPKKAGGIRFGRVSKELVGFTVDAVLMASPGPRHRHGNGEIDLCFATSGAPTFDGNPAGWTVYPPGSTHVPTVQGGEMLILYFLPGGEIEFLQD